MAALGANVQMCPDAHRCAQMHTDVPRCTQMCPDAHRCAQMHTDVQMCTCVHMCIWAHMCKCANVCICADMCIWLKPGILNPTCFVVYVFYIHFAKLVQ